MSTQTTVTGRLLTNPKRFFAGEDNDYGKYIYSAQIVLDDASVTKLEKAREATIAEIWEGKPMPSSANDYVIREGDDEEYEGTFGKKFIIAKKQDGAPKVIRKVNGKMEPVSAEDGIFYTGCDVALSVDVYGSKGNKAKKIPAYLTVGLRGVMFLRDNTPIGNVVNAESEFGDMPDSEVEVEDF